MNATLGVPAGGPLFDGHFPGRPILAGVAELALALDALRQDGKPLPISGIAHARLRQLVLPGDRLDIIARDAGAHRLRVDLKRDDAIVANAEFILGIPRVSPVRAQSNETLASAARFPALDELIPHRPPMRFLDAITAESESGLRGTAVVPATCALVVGGQAPALVAVEAAAQAAAAWEALRRRRTGGNTGPRVGYLVALKSIAFFATHVPAGRRLEVRVELEAAALPLAHYRIAVDLGERAVATGTVATFLSGADA
ncbi:MAG TPA: hypothetical protein VHB46_18235 [Burkholderiales bacterium]|nr:hypothetical protein [Burkholderiales bacterium]